MSGGKWIGEKKAKHRCALPEIGLKAPGSRWKCDCGVVYVVKSESQHGESWKQWSREAKR